jgi:hypothetical protein
MDPISAISATAWAIAAAASAYSLEAEVLAVTCADTVANLTCSQSNPLALPIVRGAAAPSFTVAGNVRNLDRGHRQSLAQPGRRLLDPPFSTTGPTK